MSRREERRASIRCSRCVLIDLGWEFTVTEVTEVTETEATELHGDTDPTRSNGETENTENKFWD